jgi:hypothetical protein
MEEAKGLDESRPYFTARRRGSISHDAGVMSSMAQTKKVSAVIPLRDMEARIVRMVSAGATRTKFSAQPA